MLMVERSLAVTVVAPGALKVRLKFCVPDTRAVFGGSVALGALEVIPTKSVTLFTTFQLASTALTVTLKGPSTDWAMGVPVLPLAVPGAALSPGTSSWSLVKGPTPTATLPERKLVKVEAVKLSVMG